MSYYLSGFGAIDFSSDAVWSDWLAGANGDNAAGKQAANSIRAALGQLGYGPFVLDQSWGTSADKAGYTRFAQQQKIPAASGMPAWWPTQVGLIRLGELVKQGGTPGGGPVQEFHEVGGQVVPGASSSSGATRASMSAGTKVGLVVLGLGLLGGLALMSKKKSGDRSHQASA